MSCNGRMYSMLRTLQEACNKYVDLYVVNVNFQVGVHELHC